MTFKEFYTRFRITLIQQEIGAYAGDVLSIPYNELDIIIGWSYMQLQDIWYLDLRYDEDTTFDMILAIWTNHLMRIRNIIDMNKNIVNKGLNYQEEGNNKSSFGYGGYDLDNQDGQFQANVNTMNISKTNYKDIIDIINNQQYSIYGPLKEDILDQLLIIIY